MPYSFATSEELAALEQRVAALEEQPSGGGGSTPTVGEPFYAARFTELRRRPMRTWTGGDPQDLTAWLSAQTSANVTIVSNTTAGLTLNVSYGPPSEGWPATPVMIGGWVGADPYSGGSLTVINPVEQVAYWRTSDPNGRPVRAADVEAP